ncbi:MAG: hypothetical protein M3Q40_06495 [Pseudomonadota bacterium]|nr:hypothetical protein [Pseudomonadota bacterium]
MNSFSLRVACATAVLAMVCAPTAAGAQSLSASLAQWGLDPQALVMDGQALLARAPDSAIDGLFQAVHASAQEPTEAEALCALFDPAADRSLAGLNAVAARLGPASRDRFATAVAEAFVAAAQSPPRPLDEGLAQQQLKAAGVRAALQDEGFVAGLNGQDHGARCRSVRSLLDVLQQRPLAERSSVVRLLLSQGLNYVALADGSAAGP